MAGWCAERSTIFLFRYFLSVTDRSKNLLVGQVEIQLCDYKASQRHCFQAGVATGLQLEDLAPLVVLQGFRSEPGRRILLRFSKPQEPVRIVDHGVEGCAPDQDRNNVLNITAPIPDRLRSEEGLSGQRLNRIDELTAVRCTLTARFPIVAEQSRTMMFVDLLEVFNEPRPSHDVAETVVHSHQPKTLSTTARRSSTLLCM